MLIYFYSCVFDHEFNLLALTPLTDLFLTGRNSVQIQGLRNQHQILSLFIVIHQVFLEHLQKKLYVGLPSTVSIGR